MNWLFRLWCRHPQRLIDRRLNRHEKIVLTPDRPIKRRRVVYHVPEYFCRRCGKVLESHKP